MGVSTAGRGQGKLGGADCNDGSERTAMMEAAKKLIGEIFREEEERWVQLFLFFLGKIVSNISLFIFSYTLVLL